MNIQLKWNCRNNEKKRTNATNRKHFYKNMVGNDPTISVITLNEIALNTPIKRQKFSE